MYNASCPRKKFSVSHPGKNLVFIKGDNFLFRALEVVEIDN